MNCCSKKWDVDLNHLLAPEIHFVKLLYALIKLSSWRNEGWRAACLRACPIYYYHLTAAWRDVSGPFPVHLCEEPRTTFFFALTPAVIIMVMLKADVTTTVGSFSSWEALFLCHELGRSGSNPGVNDSPGEMHLSILQAIDVELIYSYCCSFNPSSVKLDT